MLGSLSAKKVCSLSQRHICTKFIAIAHRPISGPRPTPNQLGTVFWSWVWSLGPCGAPPCGSGGVSAQCEQFPHSERDEHCQPPAGELGASALVGRTLCRQSDAAAADTADRLRAQKLPHPPRSTRTAGLILLAPPSQAPMAPKASSATVEVIAREMSRYLWLLMNAAASSGMPV